MNASTVEHEEGLRGTCVDVVDTVCITRLIVVFIMRNEYLMKHYSTALNMCTDKRTPAGVGSIVAWQIFRWICIEKYWTRISAFSSVSLRSSETKYVSNIFRRNFIEKFIKVKSGWHPLGSACEGRRAEERGAMYSAHLTVRILKNITAKLLDLLEKKVKYEKKKLKSEHSNCNSSTRWCG